MTIHKPICASLASDCNYQQKFSIKKEESWGITGSFILYAILTLKTEKWLNSSKTDQSAVEYDSLFLNCSFVHFLHYITKMLCNFLTLFTMRRKLGTGGRLWQSFLKTRDKPEEFNNTMLSVDKKYSNGYQKQVTGTGSWNCYLLCAVHVLFS